MALADPTMRQVAESAVGLHGFGRRRRGSGVPRRPPAPHGRSQAWHTQRRPDTPLASAAPSGRRAGGEAVRREAAALQAALRARQAELDAALTDAAAARAADGGHAERLQRQLVEATGAPGPRCATGGPGLLTGTL